MRNWLQRKRLRLPRLVLIAVLIAGPVLSLGPLPRARATTFTVTKTADTHDGVCDASECSLREAVIAANGAPGANTIWLPPGTYTLDLEGADDDQAARGDLDLTDSLTLAANGSPSPIIDGHKMARVFHIVKPFIQVTLSGLTIRGGRAVVEGGGGILNTGALSLLNSSVIGNTAIGLQGGGIFNTGTLRVVNSTIGGNRASSGGGLNNSGVLTLVNSTISGNRVSGRGGGIKNSYLLYLNNVTLTGNIADRNSNRTGNGGGIFSSSGIISFKNTLIAGNFDYSVSALRHPDCSGQLRSQGYNLVGDNTGCVFIPAAGDQFGTSAHPLDPLLGLLEDNGGFTLTHALFRRSPAIDAGNPLRCTDRLGDTLTMDQRGAPRPVDGDGVGKAVCDIGAYEYGAAVPTPTPTITPTQSPMATPTPSPVPTVHDH